MNAQYAYTPDIWPSFFTAIVLAALAAYGWRRRDVPSASMFALSCLFAALWVAGLLMEVAATQPETKIFWFKVLERLAGAGCNGDHLLCD